MVKNRNGWFQLGLRVLILFGLVYLHSTLLAGDVSPIMIKIESIPDNIVPMSYYIGLEDQMSQERRAFIQIDRMIVDDREVYPEKVAAIIESEESASEDLGWKTLNLISGDFPNLFYVDSDAQTTELILWQFPEDWKAVRVEYHQRDQSGELVRAYVLVCKRAD